MSSSSSTPTAVQMSTLPAAGSAPALSATQIATCASTIEAAVKGKTVAQILAALPGLVEQVYVLVQSFLGANTSSISSVCLTVILDGMQLSGIPVADLEILDQVLTTVVPAVINLLAKYAPELEADVESCCGSLWTKLKSCKLC